jgi:predicted NACHT family NTPase
LVTIRGDFLAAKDRKDHKRRDSIFALFAFLRGQLNQEDRKKERRVKPFPAFLIPKRLRMICKEWDHGGLEHPTPLKL